ncbi:class I SAM-dependent methyltransferase [Mesorhizobium sp.]|uniref:class I SAM-dependent methyltransferase n=1 Tax=Mesorhizobium sp. TaxID=1871066 RepID=UPI00121BD491|nr:class I SAM-dependent methyltransferase [Mesorhizobium sp.]TIL33925.1 MAG: class I SAM-dependent methyltransferase [Mesorhizobium sp.]
MINSRAFLAKEGFIFDKKYHQIDRLFLKQFSAEEALEIRWMWQRIHSKESATTILYRLPKTSRQANTLWSYDRARYVETFNWLFAEIAHLKPRSAIEMGCGSGTLLRFLQANFPELKVMGIDAAPNFVEIARSSGVRAEVGDYRKIPAGNEGFDVVICNFGFDLADFEASIKPHSIEEIGTSRFCPGCSDDFRAWFADYVATWRSWGGKHARLLLTGRLPNFGYHRGVILAAADYGWRLDATHSCLLKVSDAGQVEHFPAMVFEPGETDDIVLALANAERIFRGNS